MVGIDTNILLYAYDKGSPLHGESKALIRSMLGKDGIAISNLSLLEFFSVSTDGRKMTSPLSAEEAFAVLEKILNAEEFYVCYESAGVMSKAFHCAAELNILRYGINDVYIAMSLAEKGFNTILTRNTKDFKKFDFIKAINPFSQSEEPHAPCAPPSALRAKRFLPYARQTIDEKDVASVCQVLRSEFLTTGPNVEEFESDLCELTGAKHAIACSNGTTALYLACLALGIGENSLGVTSPITFLSSANCVEFCNGRVDFIDIDPNTLCLSSDRLEEYCQDVAVPDLVIPVDFAGVPADLPAIKDLADKYGFKVIEDAAHSIGSTYTHNGTTYHCGGCAHSDMAIFSFHPVKTITTGEGGAVLTNDDEMAEKIRQMRSHGIMRGSDLSGRNDRPWYYEMADLNFNSRITDFQCALGKSQLKKLPQFKRRRREIVERYNAAFNGHSALITPEEPEHASACYHLYPIQFSGGNQIRLAIFQSLQAAGVFCQIHYIPVYRQPYYHKRYGFPTGKCPQAEAYYSRCLSLPLYPTLKDDEVDFVIENILSV